MKRTLISIALLLANITLVAVQQRSTGQNPQNTPQNAAETRATIEGTVSRVDNGQPLRGARVTLRTAGARGQNPLLQGLGAAGDGRLLANIVGAIATVATDSNGRFTITGVQPGQYQITAEREGFIRAEYGQRTPTGNGVTVPVTANQRLTIDLKMLQGSIISGRVITPEGEGVAEASVEAYTYQYSDGQRTLAGVKTARTNDLGEYRLFWLDPGDYFVSVTSDQNEGNLPVATVDVSQTRGGRGGQGGAAFEILSTALGERGGPIVQALGVGTNSNPPVFYPGTMDPDGAVPITVNAAVEVRGMDFNLRPMRTATVSGRVVAPFPLTQQQGNANVGRGRGANIFQEGGLQLLLGGGAPVQLSLNRIGSSQTGLAGLLSLGLGSTPVNADGSFEMKGVAPGEYNLTARARDPNGQQHTARTRISVGTADVTNVTVAVRPGVEVRGRILFEGTPPQQFKMSNLRVSLTAEDVALPGLVGFAPAAGAAGRGNAIRIAQGGQGELAQVTEDGTFTIPDVGAMEYRVRIVGLPQGAYLQAGRIESKDALNEPFTVEQGAQLQLQLGFAPGRVSGTVTDDRGAPTQGVQAVLVPDEARRGRSDAYFSSTTDQNGQYTFTNVPPGRYKLFAWEDIPAGAYQYPDFIRRYEDRGQSITVNANGAITADARLIPAK
jgi:protocatechuate 3,4-dioxygenase beta subunit